MVTAVYIVDEELQPIIYRKFKFSPRHLDPIRIYRESYNKHDPPVVFRAPFHYITLVRWAVRFVAVIYNEPQDIMEAGMYLCNFSDLLMRYFNSKTLDKSYIYDNLNLVYELLDETMDFGYPQITEYNMLQEYIKIGANLEDNVGNPNIVKSTTSEVSWRPKGIFYHKNEFFVDVVEHATLYYSNGAVRNHSIHGKMHCKSFLSGMPVVKTHITCDDANFSYHHCVKQNEEALTFVPPDGEFKLCEYETIPKKSLIMVNALTCRKSKKKPSVKLELELETNFGVRNSSEFLDVHVPLSKLQEFDIDLKTTPRFKCSQGVVNFDVSENKLIWKIGAIKGNQKLTMLADFKLETEPEPLGMNPPPMREIKLEQIYDELHGEDEKDHRPVTVNFSIPFSTRAKIEYLVITEDQFKYDSFPWIKYKTMGSYVFNM